jgi:hypothetical protein
MVFTAWDVHDVWLSFPRPERGIGADGHGLHGFRYAGRPLEQQEVRDECSSGDSTGGLGYRGE